MFLPGGEFGRGRLIMISFYICSMDGTQLVEVVSVQQGVGSV